MRHIPTYQTWQDMKQRCTNPRSHNYARYGGRGITFCQRWASYANFLADMGERAPGMTIERIDNDGNYEPSNCRWATKAEQHLNQTRAGHAIKPTCARGHKLLGDNVLVAMQAGRPVRICRTCKRIDGLARYHKKRDERVARGLQLLGNHRCSACGRFFGAHPKAMWRMVYRGTPPTPDHERFRCGPCVEKYGPIPPQHGIRPEASVGYINGVSNG